MTSYSESLKILNQKKVNMSDLSKVYKNVKGKIEGVTWQGVRTKASRPILKELLKSKIQDSNKKFIKQVGKKEGGRWGGSAEGWSGENREEY